MDGREIRDLKKQLQELAQDVLEGRVDRGNAVVVNQILTTHALLEDLRNQDLRLRGVSVAKRSRPLGPADPPVRG